MQLGQMIVKLRKEQGLTQETFAKKFNVTRQTVSNWENEKSYPDLHTLVKISDEFNLSLDILLKGDSTMIKDIDKKVKKHALYKGIIIGLIILVVGLSSIIYLTNKSMNDTTKNYVANGTEMIELYDSSSKELLLKYDDKKSVQKFISDLNIENWKKAQINEDMSPQYLIKFYDTMKGANEHVDVNEITIYEGGEYATIFMTSPGGVKQSYKTDINLSELMD